MCESERGVLHSGIIDTKVEEGGGGGGGGGGRYVNEDFPLLFLSLNPGFYYYSEKTWREAHLSSHENMERREIIVDFSLSLSFSGGCCHLWRCGGGGGGVRILSFLPCHFHPPGGFVLFLVCVCVCVWVGLRKGAFSVAAVAAVVTAFAVMVVVAAVVKQKRLISQDRNLFLSICNVTFDFI